MPRVKLVPAEEGHLDRIAANMRAIDRREVAALDHSPIAALKAGYDRALWSFTALVDGKPEALLGVVAVSMVEGIGTPFFLGTDAVYRCRRALLTKGPDVVALMCRTFSVLENLVSVENEAAIRLLRFWGFEVGSEPVPVGGTLFVPFRMCRDV